MRPALAYPASYREIKPGRDAYVFNTQLRVLVSKNKNNRFWSFHQIPTTVALPDNRYAKSLNSFTDHCDDVDRFTGLLDEYERFGVPRPSGYADVFHETFQSPHIPWSVNASFASCLAGGWQQATNPGVHRGVYFKYDMRSAYLWSATLGLPDTRTYTRSLKISSNVDGLYRVILQNPVAGAPFPYNQARECIATNQEIETYSLPVQSVVSGVCWKRTLPGDPIVEAVRKVSTWKQAARAYWGRWGQIQKVQCNANGKKWFLPNVALNIPWAHLIVSRVRMRLWEYSKNSVHVYVDSVITSDVLPTGDNIGDWRLEKTYNAGVFVRGPGQYGALDAPVMERYAGAGINSLRRNTSVAIESVGNNQVQRINDNGKGNHEHNNDGRILQAKDNWSSACRTY